MKGLELSLKGKKLPVVDYSAGRDPKGQTPRPHSPSSVWLSASVVQAQIKAREHGSPADTVPDSISQGRGTLKRAESGSGGAKGEHPAQQG